MAEIQSLLLVGKWKYITKKYVYLFEYVERSVSGSRHMKVIFHGYFFLLSISFLIVWKILAKFSWWYVGTMYMYEDLAEFDVCFCLFIFIFIFRFLCLLFHLKHCRSISQLWNFYSRWKRNKFFIDCTFVFFFSKEIFFTISIIFNYFFARSCVRYIYFQIKIVQDIKKCALCLRGVYYICKFIRSRDTYAHPVMSQDLVVKVSRF